MSDERSPKEQLAYWWRRFGEEDCGPYSPLYRDICVAVSEDDDVLDLILEAPPRGHQPNVLLAAVHFLVLRGLDHPLAELYAGRRPDLAPKVAGLFRDVVLDHRDEVLALLANRHTQTNECGRSAVLAPAVAWAAAQLDGGQEGIGLLDLGCSAGLNLHMDRYLLDYGKHGEVGPDDATVRITCELRGSVWPASHVLPPIVHRVGLDRDPVDLADDDHVDWLLACVWPDTGRLDRTRAAFALARSDPPPVVVGDMVDDLAAALGSFPEGLPVVAMCSWALAYLPSERRLEVLAALAEESRRRPVAWVSAELPGIVAPVPVPPIGDGHEMRPSLLGFVTFDHDGEPLGEPLGLVHPHGAWLDWQAR